MRQSSYNCPKSYIAISLTTAYIKILHHDRVKILGGIDVGKSNKLKRCMIRCYWYFLNKVYKYESTVCNGCYDV